MSICTARQLIWPGYWNGVVTALSSLGFPWNSPFPRILYTPSPGVAGFQWHFGPIQSLVLHGGSLDPHSILEGFFHPLPHCYQ